MRTPFGTIYSTNITPDPDTGIGRWSEAAFRRALREGVSRDGRQLYPAFPYDHFTLASDQDDQALYAYLMTRDPVRAIAPANELPFPLNVRLLIAGWKLLYFREGSKHSPGRPGSGCAPRAVATAATIYARSLSASKLTRKKFASWVPKAYSCAPSSLLQCKTGGF